MAYRPKRPKKSVFPDLQLAAWTELSQLRAMDALPAAFEKARIAADAGTPIYDVNGEILFVRVPILKGEASVGFADIAVHAAFGEALLSASAGGSWDADKLSEEGRRAAKELGEKGVDRAELRFVAFSMPKIALQFLVKGKEVLMLELFTWKPVPPSTRSGGGRLELPSSFERWSFLDEMPDDELEKRCKRYEYRIGALRDRFKKTAKLEVLDSKLLLESLTRVRPWYWASRELHFSTRNADHATCYEVRGQETSVWCVGASVQMLLDFYRYEYTQVRLATELGLGTLTNPNGLPYSRIGDVVTVLEALTVNALDATMNTSPTFGQFESEINANRPLISFIPGHSRTVAGYLRSYFLSVLGIGPFRGLLVYDPWPPNAGVITRWENFDASSYFATYTAVLQRA